MKKILAITPNANSAVYRQRVGMFIPALRDRGFLVDPVEYAGLFGRLSSILRRDYDLVWIVRKMVDPISARILRHSPQPVVFDFDDAIMIRSWEKKDSFRSRSRELKFARSMRLADAVVAGSGYLANIARSLNPHVHMVPTGVDVHSYPLKSHEDGTGSAIRVVWIGGAGTLRFLLNEHALFRRITECWPQVHFRIICNRFPDWDDVPLEKVVWSPDAEGPALAESDIAISPMPDTPFTRGKCGFKLVQYMAAGLPVVTTPIGAHMEIVEEGVNGFLVEGEQEWLKAIGRLVENGTLRKKFGLAGRKRVEERYDVTILVEVIASVFASLAAR